MTPRAIAVTLAESALEVGGHTQATAAVVGPDGKALSRSVTWSSSTPRVATVSSAGVVTAIDSGTASIQASADGVSGSATLNVSLVPIAQLTVLVDTNIVASGRSVRAHATALDKQGNPLAGRRVLWRSADTTVAAVDSLGVVLGRRTGQTTIAATAEGHTGSAGIEVRPGTPSVITVTPGTVRVGRSLAATALVADANGNPVGNAVVTWSSSDPAIASVSAAGIVQGVVAGRTLIRAAHEGVSGAAEFTVTPVPPPVALAAIIDYGVVGDPSGAVSVPIGDTLRYAFRPRPGFGPLRVSLDGASVPDSGDIVMDRAHTLIATADSAMVIPPQVAALETATRALLTSSDPVTGLQSLLDRYGELASTSGFQPMSAALGSMWDRAFAGTADSVVMRVLGAQVDGTVFRLSSPPQALTGPSLTRAPSGQPAVPKGVALGYVNGIWTHAPSANADFAQLVTLAPAAGFRFFAPLNPDKQWHYYNATWTQNPSYSSTACTAALAATLVRRTLLAVVRALNTCTNLNDLTTAGQQLANVLMHFPGPANPKSAQLATLLQSELRGGRSVLVVAHSQGNLMVQEAIRLLLASVPASFQARAASCVNVVALAAPTSQGFPVHAEGLYVRGAIAKDILLRLPNVPQSFGPASQRPTDISTWLDRALLVITPPLLLGGPAALQAATFVADAFLHYFRDSYLAGKESAAWIAQELANGRQRLRQSCTDSLAASPGQVSLQTGQQSAVSVAVFGTLGQTVSGTGVRWTSADPTIASVSVVGSGAVIKGIGPGITKVVVEADGAAADTVDVTVAPAAGSVTISPKRVNLIRPASLSRQLTATVRDSAGKTVPNATVTWVSRQPSVANVSAAGLAAGASDGTTRIVASSGTKSDSTAVTVAGPLTGYWDYSYTESGTRTRPDGSTYPYTCTITARWLVTQNGGQLASDQRINMTTDCFAAGTIYYAISGTIAGSAVQWRWNGGSCATHNGTISGNQITGSVPLCTEPGSGQTSSGTFSVTITPATDADVLYWPWP